MSVATALPAGFPIYFSLEKTMDHSLHCPKERVLASPLLKTNTVSQTEQHMKQPLEQRSEELLVAKDRMAWRKKQKETLFLENFHRRNLHSEF